MTSLALKDKVAIVTGAKRGLGFAIAARFIGEGATVVLADVLDAAAEATQLGAAAQFVHCDVSREAAVQALVAQTLARHGRIDVLVNNAGVEFAKTVETTTEAEWDQLMGVNLKGVFLCSKAVIPVMRGQGGGVIVNVASELGIVGAAGVAAYCASKGGVVLLSKAMAIDHGPEGIRINSLCPGPVQTELLEGVFQASADPAALRASFEQATVLKRLGTPQDVASAAVFLASDQSAFMAGAELVVDGGWTAQ